MSHQTHTPEGKLRARGHGLTVLGTPGPWNAITDVPGVEVGLATMIEGQDIRTGVTAIHPRGAGATDDPVIAGWHSLNGNGELTGTTWISEGGMFSSPITISSTNALGACHTASLRWVLRTHPELAWEGYLPVCGETWDGWLNHPGVEYPAEELAFAALDGATTGPVEEGSVGGGTGMVCYSYKAGSGTASRLVDHQGTEHVVGVWAQANFGSREELIVCGHKVGLELLDDDPIGDAWKANLGAPPGAGSIIVIVATDAPMLPGQCAAMARRVSLGLSRTGANASHYSGDIFLAFTTGNPGAVTANLQTSQVAYQQLTFVPWDQLDPFLTATVQATEEAVLNALCAGGEMIGTGERRAPAFPAREVAERIGATPLTG